MSTDKPLFTIGVPTYNRKELLKQALLSLLGQSFTDFEIIVGNDFTGEVLTPENTGIADPRVRFLNHERNLGELGNVNSLLEAARGRYFTCQFDDDLAAPSFLEEVRSALAEFGYPACAFTSYSLVFGTDAHKFGKSSGGRAELLTGRDFLRGYLSGRLPAMGFNGVYETAYLKKEGGARRLAEGPIAVYSEYLLLLRAGLLPEVAYINSPLVASRIHGNSWSTATRDAELFKQAGLNLVRAGVGVLSGGGLENDFRGNIRSVLGSVVRMAVMKNAMRNRKLDRPDALEYISTLEKEFGPLKNTELYGQALAGLEAARKNISRYALDARVKMLLSLTCLKYAHLAYSMFSRFRKKAF
ncbi:MAG: glycosyltransferase [Elusimicrobia bacterium]|nr:glycosyltransferase [Elusimicrobiota bacterium]